jgi:hypothetical protein
VESLIVDALALAVEHGFDGEQRELAAIAEAAGIDVHVTTNAARDRAQSSASSA